MVGPLEKNQWFILTRCTLVVLKFNLVGALVYLNQILIQFAPEFFTNETKLHLNA